MRNTCGNCIHNYNADMHPLGVPMKGWCLITQYKVNIHKTRPSCKYWEEYKNDKA